MKFENYFVFTSETFKSINGISIDESSKITVPSIILIFLYLRLLDRIYVRILFREKKIMAVLIKSVGVLDVFFRLFLFL